MNAPSRPLHPLHPLPILARLVLSVAVLSPVAAVAVVLANASAPPVTPLSQAFGVTILVGLAAVATTLVLAVTDPALRDRRGRWIAGFLLATSIAAALYLWMWQWRRPPSDCTLMPARR